MTSSSASIAYPGCLVVSPNEEDTILEAMAELPDLEESLPTRLPGPSNAKVNQSRGASRLRQLSDLKSAAFPISPTHLHHLINVPQHKHSHTPSMAAHAKRTDGWASPRHFNVTPTDMLRKSALRSRRKNLACGLYYEKSSQKLNMKRQPLRQD